MPARLLPTCILVLSACGPALTLRRLAPPTAALAAKNVELKITSQGAENVAGTGERVSDVMRKAAAERLALAGYAVCTPAPCGEGVLELTISESSFVLQPEVETASMAELKSRMNAMMAASGFGGGHSVSYSSDSIVKARLDLTAQLTLPSGKTSFKRTSHFQRDDRGKAPSTVMKESIELVSKELFEPLRRNTPLTVVQLEGGGRLNRGVELLHERKFVEAAEYFAELTRSQPELDGASYDLGIALEAESDWERALAAYREAARRAPNKAHYAAAVTAAEAALRGGD